MSLCSDAASYARILGTSLPASNRSALGAAALCLSDTDVIQQLRLLLLLLASLTTTGASFAAAALGFSDT